MSKRIRVAFDLDGVIIDKPPLIPKKLIEILFRGFEKDGLHYRFPKSKLEQKIRKISHFYLFRPPIKKNIEFIGGLAKDGKYELYIVSSRYSFLKDETEKWLEKRKIDGIFQKVFINMSDEQPHLFKEKVLKKLKPDIFVDDDCELVNYLTGRVETKIYCFSRDSSYARVTKIASLAEIN